MSYSEYARLCERFRAEIAGIDVKTPTQRRKAVDLMKLARKMGDFRSAATIVGCSHESIRRWRAKYNQEPCTGAVSNGVRCDPRIVR